MREQRVTIRQQLITVIYTSIAELNGEDTEEDLNMMISEKIADDKLNNAQLVTDGYIRGSKFEPMCDILNVDKIEPNGVWIYKDNTIDEWVLKRYDTVTEAVREAVGMIDAKIICNGKIIEYDTIDEGMAYYLDSKTEDVKLVTLEKQVETV